MHIPDGFIDLPTSAVAAAVAVPTVVIATRRAGRQLAEREVPVAGLVVAYLVVAQLLVFPVGLGTGAHLLGTGLALVLVGPWVAYACVAVVLVLQALLLADGGISVLGLNAVNNGLVPLLVGWAVLAATRPWWRDGASARPVAAGLAATAGVVAGALAFCLEFAVGGTDVLATATVTAGFLTAQTIVAVGEGVLTAVLVAALVRSRPDLVLRWWPGRDGTDAGGRTGREPDVSGGHGHEVDPAAPLDGPIERLAPEAKVVGAVAFLLVVVVTPVPATTAWLVEAAVLGVLAVAALLPARVVARRLVFEVPFVALAVALVVFGTGPRVPVAGFSLSEPGLTAAWTILARATAGVLVASILAATTSQAELLAALGRLHLPRLLCTLAATAVRYLAVLRAELDRLRLAQELRRPDGGRLRPAEVAGIGAALFVRAYERGERVHLARAARGVAIGAGDESALEATAVPRAGRRDWLVSLAPAAVAGAAVLGSLA